MYSSAPNRAELDEFLEQHRGDLSMFWCNNPGIIPHLPVDRMSGVSRRLPLQQGRIAAKGSRRSKVGTGGQTPQGHVKDDLIPFSCDEFRFKEGINEVRKKEVEDYMNDVDGLLRDRCAFTVLLDGELDLHDVLLGDGVNSSVNHQSTITEVLDNADRFSDPASKPVNIIAKGIRRLGKGCELFMGWDVAYWMSFHPQFTNVNAGTGSEFIGFDQVIAKLKSMGISRVHIGGQEFQDNPREFSFQQGFMHDGVFCLNQPGNIRQIVFEELFYDSYEIEDTRDAYVRALRTTVAQVQFEDSTIAYKNAIDPAALDAV